MKVTGSLNSKLSALWNRSAGDCLLDAALQVLINRYLLSIN